MKPIINLETLEQTDFDSPIFYILYCKILEIVSQLTPEIKTVSARVVIPKELLGEIARRTSTTPKETETETHTEHSFWIRHKQTEVEVYCVVPRNG
jgi:hypothetical protein